MSRVGWSTAMSRTHDLGPMVIPVPSMPNSPLQAVGANRADISRGVMAVWPNRWTHRFRVRGLSDTPNCWAMMLARRRYDANPATYHRTARAWNSQEYWAPLEAVRRGVVKLR